VAGVERDRAKVAGEIGAFLYAHASKSEDSEARARGLIDWLRQRWPGNERLQADALTAFAATVGNEQRQAADELLGDIVRVLGADYRRAVIESLRSRRVPNGDLYSALLQWGDTESGGDPTPFEASLRAALAARPSDLFTLQVAAVYCPAKKCVRPDAAAELVRVDPDNMFHWLLLSMNETEDAAMGAALHEAARRTRFDDYLGQSYQAYVSAIEAAKVPVPPLLARPIAALAPNERPEMSIAMQEGNMFPIASWQPLVRYCVRPDLSSVPPQVRADCIRVGEVMGHSRGGLISQMIGVVLVRSLAKGTPKAEEMQELRAQYVYLSSLDDQLTPGQQLGYPAQRYLDDLASGGELVAMQRRAEFFGLSTKRPADWKPDDPERLLTGRERLDRVLAAEERVQKLAAQGDAAGVLAAYSQVEAVAADLLKGRNAWRLPRLLLAVGKARTQLGDLAGAEKNLLAAWEIVQSFGPGSSAAHECAQALLTLYQARQKAEPGKTADAMLAEWRQTVADFEASGDPRGTP